MHVEKLVLKDRVGDHDSIRDGCQTAVGQNRDRGHRVMVNADDWEDVVGAEYHDERLCNQNSLEALSLPRKERAALSPKNEDRGESLSE